MNARRGGRKNRRRRTRAVLLGIVLGLAFPASLVATGPDPALKSLSLHAEAGDLQVFVAIAEVAGAAVETPQVCGPKAVELTLQGAWSVPRNVVAGIPELAALRVGRRGGETALRFEFRRAVRDARLFADDSRGEAILLVAFRAEGSEMESPVVREEPTVAEGISEHSLLTPVSAAASAGGTTGAERRSRRESGEAWSPELVLLLLALSGAAVGAWGVLARRASAAVAESGGIDELNRRIAEELRRFEEATRGWEED